MSLCVHMYSVNCLSKLISLIAHSGKQTVKQAWDESYQQQVDNTELSIDYNTGQAMEKENEEASNQQAVNPIITEGVISCKNEDAVNSSIEGTVGSNTEDALGFNAEDIVGSNTDGTIDSNTVLVENEYAELSHSHLPGHTDVAVNCHDHEYGEIGGSINNVCSTLINQSVIFS